MKSFKRVTALTIALAMTIASLFSMCAFADTTLTDVADDNPYSTAIRSLVGSGVVTGYEDGTFKPDNTITRAEFAAIFARALAGNVTLSATTAKFPDVPTDHWANTYIAYAVNTGAVNGYEDGTFRPDNPVSYGEAVKMLVCALGYSSVVPATDPWYAGYINVAGQIGLTKNAGGVGDAEAKRGIIAQLVYDMANCKKLVQTGTDSSGKPTFSTKGDSDDYESESGVLTAVFEETLTGESAGLNKQQVMIDNDVYYIGDLSLDVFYPYLGRNVEIEYEEGSKNTIVSFTEGSNDEITVTDTLIDDISGRTFTYYKDEDASKVSTIKLSDKLNVVYNGYGVKLADIDDTFIQKYLNVSTGKITFVNNDGKSDYDVAFVTSYDTYFVTGVSTTDDTIKITDTYAGKDITLTKNDCMVYRVSSKGGSKTEATTSAIAKNVVASVAKPYDRSEGTEIIVSTVKLSGAKVTGKKKDTVEISNTVYDTSAYYNDLLAADSSKYSVSVGDSATFYFDFNDRLVYVSKTETTEPYGYLIDLVSNGGLTGDVEVRFMNTNGNVTTGYYLKDRTKINGTTYDPSGAKAELERIASEINTGKDSAITVNATYAQLMKYQTTSQNGKNYITEITTLDTSSDNYITVYELSDGKSKYTLSNSKTTFTNASGKKFTINDKTVIYSVPNNRKAEDKEYKKVSRSNLQNDSKYIVEAYDITSNVAKVVLLYDGSNAVNAKIYNESNCIFVEKCDDKKKDTDNNDKLVINVKYYEAGSDTLSEMMTEELDTLSGVNPGDVIRIAKDNGRIVGYQRVFVGGKLYDYSSLDYPFDTFVSSDNYISHVISGDSKYQVIYGTVSAEDVDNGSLSVVPVIITDDSDYTDTVKDNYVPFTVTSSTQYYKWNNSDDNYSIVTSSEINSAENVSPSAATKVVVISIYSSVKAVYIIE